MLNLKISLNCNIIPHWPLTIVLHRIHKKCLWDNPIVRKLKFSNLSDRNRLKIGPIKFLWKSNFYFWDRSQLLCILAHARSNFKKWFWVKSLRPFLKVKMYEIPMDNTYCIIFSFDQFIPISNFLKVWNRSFQFIEQTHSILQFLHCIVVKTDT